MSVRLVAVFLLLVLFHGTMMTAMAAATTLSGPVKALPATPSFSACIMEPILNNTCLFLNATQVSKVPQVSIQLKIDNVLYLNSTFYPSNTQSLFCLSQTALLSLMQSNSDLSPYTQQIQNLIQVFPSSLFLS